MPIDLIAESLIILGRRDLKDEYEANDSPHKATAPAKGQQGSRGEREETREDMKLSDRKMISNRHRCRMILIMYLLEDYQLWTVENKDAFETY